MTALSFSLDKKQMRVTAVGSTDGIDRQTVFKFYQSDHTVWASYTGGNIAQGFLTGSVTRSRFESDYIQVTRAGRRDKGTSHCTVERSKETGLVQLRERFEWSSRKGSGIKLPRRDPKVNQRRS